MEEREQISLGFDCSDFSVWFRVGLLCSLPLAVTKRTALVLPDTSYIYPY